MKATTVPSISPAATKPFSVRRIAGKVSPSEAAREVGHQRKSYRKAKAKPTKSRSEENIKDLDLGGFRVVDYLKNGDYSALQDAAPGWDIDELTSIFDNAIKEGRLERPRHPRAAFMVWVSKFTKGMAPP